MVLLALEASQRVLSVAVRDDSGVIHEEVVPAGKHDGELLPAIDRLYRRLDLDPWSTTAVGVSIGPGGFTGLRIAVATAKMIALTQGAAVIGVPSACVVAESFEGPGPIVVGLAAKRETVWATRLTYMDGSFTVEGTPRLTDTLDLEGVAAVLADEHLPQRMREAAGDARVPVVEPVLRGAACAAIAQRMLDSGRVTDAFVLGPIYPRPPEAVVRWDGRRKGR